MKNFKRVISAVIALALSASTLVAVSAAKFADVDNATANADAINVLAALDIIHGMDEDGELVFKPEDNITRAQAAVMIVGALNMNKDAEAAAGYSKFTDVNEQTSWASGYVNVGVAQGYINGMDATTFAPNENVTYAQMCVMLTLITGYGDYAAANGGYPTGYMAMAASAGINKGVALSADTQLKRGQVAQMLYNAITTPVLGITAYKLDGNTYEKLDGITQPKKTVLSDKFDAVEVKATIDAFPAAGKVNVTITDADRYTASANWGNFTWGNVIVDNDLDLSNYLKQEVKAIFQLDSVGKTHLVSVKGTSAVETLELAADSYVNTYYAADKQIKFDATRYTFESTGVDLYVNGEQYGATAITDAPIDDVLSRAVGTVKFAKVGGANNYNAIFADIYHTGQVASVDYKNGTTTVKFSTTYADNLPGKTYNKIEVSDNDLETEAVKLTVKLDGEEIELKDIQENDIIAVKTEFSVTGSTISKSAGNKNIIVLVSRDTVSGQLTSKETGTNENAFTIDSEVYAAVNKNTIDLKVGEKYNTIYLDAFGRVYSYNDETVEETKNYAILAKVYDKTEVTLILPDGSKREYEVKDLDVWGATAHSYTATEVGGTKYTVDHDSNPATAEVDVIDQGAAVNSVVEYKIKKGQISDIKPVVGVAFAGEKYKGAVSKISTVGVSSATGIVNVEGAASYKDYKSMAVADLIDDENYSGAGFGKIGTTNNYSLVILTVAGFDYGANTRFAVVYSDNFSQGSDAEGYQVDQLKVLLNGEETTLNFTSAAKTAFGAPKIGDAFFYVLDADGDVKATDIIARTEIDDAGTFTLASVFANGTYGPKWTDLLSAPAGKNIQLIRGIVVGASSNTVRIVETPGAAVDQALDIDTFESYAIGDDCVIYTYDTDAQIDADKDRLDAEGTLRVSDFKSWRVTEVGTKAPFNASTALSKVVWNIKWSVTPAAADLTARGISSKLFQTLEGTTASEKAQYAMALVVDDKVVEIYEVIQ